MPRLSSTGSTSLFSPYPSGIRVSRTFCKFASVLTLLLFLPQQAVRADNASDINVRVISCLWETFMPPSFTISLNAGFNASLASRNWTIAERVNVAPVYPNNLSSAPQDFIKEQLEKSSGEIVVVLGPLGDNITALSIPLLKQHEAVAFAPITGSSETRRWIPELYFLRMDPSTEVLVLIRYALSQLRVLRLGLMHITGSQYGDKEYGVILSVLSRLGFEPSSVFNVPRSKASAALDKPFNDAFEQFAAGRPQAVILCAPPMPETAKFLVKLAADRRTAEAYVLASSAMQASLERMWLAALRSAQRPFTPGKVIITGTNPLAKDGGHKVIQRFQKAMREYLRTHPADTGISDPNYFLTHDSEGELMVYGWMAGEVLSQALGVPEWLVNRSTFKDSLYQQRRYVLDDFVIGDFGGNCTGRAEALGAICQCNQGGGVVYVKKLVGKFTLETQSEGSVVLDSSACYGSFLMLRAPLNGVVPFMNDSPAAVYASGSWASGARHLIGDGKLGQLDQFFLHSINTSTAGALGDLAREQLRATFTAVFGVVEGRVLKLLDTVFIDPITLEPQLNRFRRHVIHLSPTVEQQLIVLTRYLSTASRTTVHAVLRGRDAHGIRNVLRRALKASEMRLQSAKMRGNSAKLDKYLPTSGAVFVVGLAPGDVGVLANHLTKHADLCVFVLFFDVAILYDEFVTAFSGNAGAARLLFATSLPHWGDGKSSSVTVQRFHAAMKEQSAWTPLTLLGFSTGRLMQMILTRMERVTPDSLASFFFTESSVNVDDMRYGVFNDVECSANEGGFGSSCRTNYGATRISVWSMARAMDAALEPLTDPLTPPPQLVNGAYRRLTKLEVAGVVCGAIVGALLVAILCTLLHCFLKGRDNSRAPKKESEPITLVLTDIENSTAQWAAHPELMSNAVSAHHNIIRSLISHHGCYEVKTVGDSFMIACCSAHAAVQLAHDLQQRFLHHNWKTDAIDSFYREAEGTSAEEDAEYRPPTARLDPEVYRQLWNGLRVRVGIHTGLCDIRHDEVTKGYDYYGRAANMAARTESIANGGQVLLTHATYYSLSTAERKHLDVTSLGPVPLGGVSVPVEVYQLNAVPGRTFAALRLDRAVGTLNEDGSGSDVPSVDHLSLYSDGGESAEKVVAVLHSLLGTFTLAQRRRQLTTFCERWHVALPPTREVEWDDDYCLEAMRRLGAKVGHTLNLVAHEQAETTVGSASDAPTIVVSNPTADTPEPELQLNTDSSEEEGEACCP